MIKIPRTRQKNKNIKFFSNYQKLFNFRLDAIFISLPNKIAAEATINSLKKEINVFCEKPPARNYRDFLKIYNVYKNHKNLKIKYGFNHRYHDSVIIAKDAIKKKRYGKLINIRGLYGKSKIINFKGQWRSSKILAGETLSQWKILLGKNQKIAAKRAMGQDIPYKS